MVVFDESNGVTVYSHVPNSETYYIHWWTGQQIYPFQIDVNTRFSMHPKRGPAGVTLIPSVAFCSEAIVICNNHSGHHFMATWADRLLSKEAALSRLADCQRRKDICVVEFYFCNQLVDSRVSC